LRFGLARLNFKRAQDTVRLCNRRRDVFITWLSYK
jgi:hypothetical protein